MPEGLTPDEAIDRFGEKTDRGLLIPVTSRFSNCFTITSLRQRISSRDSLLFIISASTSLADVALTKPAAADVAGAQAAGALTSGTPQTTSTRPLHSLVASTAQSHDSRYLRVDEDEEEDEMVDVGVREALWF